MLRRQFTNLLAERAGLRKWQAEEFMRVFPEVLAEVLLQELDAKCFRKSIAKVVAGS